ncbi:MAG TPA: phosphoglucosamine mutase [Acidobacteriaceae bacterium]|jgi:phosphoglucosamine mutase|nr:phosphoglucosamine mutase [Acidobacteriaceae bacterium]
MRKLFGTDGIRAVAGEAPLDARTIDAVGLALAHQLKTADVAPRVLLGMDTRESSEWIAGTLTAGLAEGGAGVESAGVITTPGIAYLTRQHGFSAGVVISASHNPWQDNGIKVFGSDGYKLPDETELRIEEEIFRQLEGGRAPGNEPAPPSEAKYRADYERFLRAAVPELDLNGLRVVLDCANGAASAIAPELFEELSGQIRLTHAAPNGRNINANCGALHPEIVAAETKAAEADLGVTFDGDADRAMFADAQGNVINGDAVMLLAARDMQRRSMLRNDTVVATTMSNMGLEAALRRDGIRMLRAPVGDKYVLERMRQENASLGGEQSGHILFPHLATTGDGLLTALVVLDVVRRSGKALHELVADLKVFPQVIVNIRVREKKPLDQIAAVADTIREAESELAECGRVVVRYSGTEALARVMIEAESEEAMRRHADRIAAAIRAELGE